ncbi:MAG: D-arabinono-1,4-lactone oxidase [Myxococcota bacterium]
MSDAPPGTLRTWGRTHAVRPESLLRPVDEQGVIDAVVQARRDGRTLKPFGALHSWSDAAICPHRMLSLDAMSGVSVRTGPAGEPRAVVAAGTRLRDLNTALDDAGLAMPILGSVAEQSLAGAVSTGTHGSARAHGNLASGVRRARLVTGTGEVLELVEGDARLDAVRVGLGALGILTELEVDVQPAFHLAEGAVPMPFAQVVEQLDTLAGAAEYVKLWWLPHTGMVQVFSAERTSEPSGFSPLGRWVDEAVVNRVAFSGVLAASRVLPSAIPTLNRLVGLTYFRPRRLVAPSHRIFNIAMPPVHREMEYAIPFERTAEALAGIEQWIRDDGLRVNFVVEVRFVKGDTGWMSPAHGRDTTQIGAYMAQSADLDAYYAGFEARMLALDGRPHWGKEFFAPADTVLQRYPRSADFLALAAELDPDGVFHNPFVSRLVAGSR